ncbi:MAG: DUF1697 domain-containing protein [Bacteroidota bacterium]
MKTFIALLRGINVSGQKKIKMADLKQALTAGRLSHVQTYIQSGNITFKSEVPERADQERKIQKVIQKEFGFEVPVLVLTAKEIESILSANPFKSEEEKSLYFVLLKAAPQSELVHEFNQQKFANEDFHITERCVYLCCKAGYGKAKLSNNLVERKLKVEATTRNFRTMMKLLEMTKV